MGEGSEWAHRLRFARSCDLVWNTHQYVQIHMRVDKVWHGVVSGESSSEVNFLRTIEVGAVGVDGWNLSNRDVDGRRQSRFMRYLSETLQLNQRPPSVLCRVARSHLHCSDPFFTVSLRDGPPLAPDARFLATTSVHGCDEREGESQEYILPNTDSHPRGQIAMYRRWERGAGE